MAVLAQEKAPPSECPMHQQEQQAPQPEPPSECPMHQAKQAEYSECPSNPTFVKDPNPEEIDPMNMMPPPNQRPSPDQPFDLPTDRQKSTIPKATGKDGETWMYPSAQMFWNAMLRKGWRWKEEETMDPETMAHIIHIHNNNNEAVRKPQAQVIRGSGNKVFTQSQVPRIARLRDAI